MPARALTNEQVLAIRNAAILDEVSIPDPAKRYGVSAATVRLINSGRSYADVGGPRKERTTEWWLGQGRGRSHLAGSSQPLAFRAKMYLGKWKIPQQER